MPNADNRSATWFITGASSGLGLALARYALDQGYNLSATARSTTKLESLLAEAPDRVLVQRLDVTAAGDAEAALAAAHARFGQIDVLINNAGYGIVGALEETPDNELRAQMETNFFGAWGVTKAALPLLRAQGSGAIVNISSLGGNLSFAGFSAYSASKFAVEGMSEALAGEMAPFGVKVLIVEPGQLRTAFAGDALRHMPVLDAYAQTVGQTRSFAHSMDGTQTGDPFKVGRAIEVALRAETTPLRLPVGGDAVDMVRAHAEQLLADLAVWNDVSRSIGFD
jgi:NAD(P)-dependent dehydrogenase (short-subunit alcohol dehydrogenase family)